MESLHHKLGDLDHKVRAYRHDMLAEFQRFYHNLLSDLFPVIAAKVERAIAPSFPSYAALDPNHADSRMDLNFTPDSAAIHVEPLSTPNDSPADPHDREKKLTGLFTPSHLPLLESDRQQHTSPPPVDAATATHPAAVNTGISVSPKPELAGSGIGTHASAAAGRDAAVDMAEPRQPDAQQGDKCVGSQTPVRPPHVRQSTDDTNSSVSSDKGESKIRPSALWRSSSASKPPTSPRRVRFEFKGLEVLPTASPQGSELPTPRPSSPMPDFDRSVLDSILGDDEEEEYEPPPRKVSSSEALRALSRAPLDESTVWTVVDPDAEEPTFTQQSPSQPMQQAIPEDSTVRQETAEQSTAGLGMSQKISVSSILNEGPEDEEVEEEKEREVDEDDSSDEEFLAMAKPKSFATKKTIRSPTPKPPSHSRRR